MSMLLTLDNGNKVKEGFFVNPIGVAHGATIDPIIRNRRYAMLFTIKNFRDHIENSKESLDE